MFTSIADLIETAAHGEINDDATKELRALITEMVRLQTTAGGVPKGKMVITIDLKLERGVFDTQTTTKVTYPPKVKPRAFLYATKDGFLSEEDTRQHSFDLGNGPKDVKDVSTGGASTVRDISDRRSLAANDKG